MKATSSTTMKFATGLGEEVLRAYVQMAHLVQRYSAGNMIHFIFIDLSF